MRSTWTDRATGKVIDLHNYAFAGMSGWNGYGTDFRSWDVDNKDGADISVKEDSMSIRYSIHPSGTRTEYKGAWSALLKVDKDCILYWVELYKDGGPAKQERIPFKAGEMQKVSFEDGSEELSLRWVYFTDYGTSLTIEQFPLYPGALVSDGVDDYGKTREALTEKVGTMLFMCNLISNPDDGKWKYLFNSQRDIQTRVYAASASGTSGLQAGQNFIPKNIKDAIGHTLISAHVREPLTPDASLYIVAAASNSELANAAIYRLILIREQLDDAQADFLKWKVEKEYRDWCTENGYEYAINQLTA